MSERKIYKTKWEPDLVEEVPTDIRATVAAWSAHVTVIMTRILIQGFPSLSPRIPFRQTLADFSVREPPHVSRSVCSYFLRNSSRPNLAGVLSPLRVPAFTTKLAEVSFISHMVQQIYTVGMSEVKFLCLLMFTTF